MSEPVREMFAAIAPRYDRANQVLSLGIHAGWRRRLVAAAQLPPASAVLDVATGTGDLALRWAQVLGPTSQVTGVDFCAPMLDEARKKTSARGAAVTFAEADALSLPFAPASFDAASIAFGIRNVDDPLRALHELARVVRPGGSVWVLEFGQPSGFFGAAYRAYSRLVLPNLGAAVTGQRAPYRYLPRTAAAFPSGERFVELMQQAGLRSPSAEPLSQGIAFLYRGVVAASDREEEEHPQA